MIIIVLLVLAVWFSVWLLINRKELDVAVADAIGISFAVLIFSLVTSFLIVTLFVPLDMGDKNTIQYSTGTAEDLIGAEQAKRSCAPGDERFLVEKGRTNDISFWMFIPPRDYKKVLICE